MTGLTNIVGSTRYQRIPIVEGSYGYPNSPLAPHLHFSCKNLLNGLHALLNGLSLIGSALSKKSAYHRRHHGRGHTFHRLKPYLVIIRTSV